MSTFVALYRGETVASARLIAVSADADLVSQVASCMLDRADTPHDPVVGSLESGRRQALREIESECEGELFRV